MTVSEYNQCVALYSDNLYRFLLKNLRDDALVTWSLVLPTTMEGNGKRSNINGATP